MKNFKKLLPFILLAILMSAITIMANAYEPAWLFDKSSYRAEFSDVPPLKKLETGFCQVIDGLITLTITQEVEEQTKVVLTIDKRGVGLPLDDKFVNGSIASVSTLFINSNFESSVQVLNSDRTAFDYLAHLDDISIKSLMLKIKENCK